MISVKPGQWVTSTAGRDEGMNYLVLAVEDGQCIRVVDGLRRTVAKPKKKSLRHVWVHRVVHHDIAARLSTGRKVSNAEIRTALLELVREDEEVG